MDVKNSSRIQLILIALYMGFAANISQVLLIREILTLCRGNELIIGIIFSSWFLGIYAGARFKPATKEKNYKRIIISILLLPVFVTVSVYSFTIVQILFPRTVGTFYSITAEIIFSLILTMPVSFFVGFYFPSLVYLISDKARKQSGGTVFYYESAGSFIGGIIFSFVLIDHLNPMAIASLLVLFAMLIIFLQKKRIFLILLIIPISLIFLSESFEKQIFQHAWIKTHTGKLIQYERTKYETITVESQEETLSIYGNGMLMYTLPDSYEARSLFHLIQSFNNNYKKILIMGSGAGSLLHNLLRTDINQLYYCEHDPGLWRILQNYAGKYYNLKSSKLIIINKDLRNYLKNSKKKFDMIISIPPSPSNIMLNRFYTKEYYSLCREHLSSNGMIITSLHGFSSYISDELRNYISSVYSAFTIIFPEHMKTTGETIYMIGAKQKGFLPENANMLVNKYIKKISINKNLEKQITENYSADELRMFFEGTRLEYFDKIIGQYAGKDNRNQDYKPSAYWKNILFNAFKEQSILYGVIQNYYIIPAIVLFMLSMAFVDINRKYDSAYLVNGLIMSIIGFVSISTMLTMIMLYQNSQGIVYYRISLINSLFMLGLALGSFIFNKKNIVGTYYIFVAITISLLLILAHTVYETELLYWILIFGFSFLTGGVFPVLFKSGNENYYASASVLDSMDHFGSIAGSLLAVIILLPLVGIRGILIVNIILMLGISVTAYSRYQLKG